MNNIISRGVTMRKLVALTIFTSFLVGCASFVGYTPTIACKEGAIVFYSEEVYYFKCATVSMDNEKIYITTPYYTSTFKWESIRTVHIYNSCNQDTYKENLKKIQELKK